MTPVRYHRAAQDEVFQEIEYLESQAPGLGRRLLRELRRIEGLIAAFPEAAEEVRPGIRRRPLRQFRYSVLYASEPDFVLILALAHHRRRPDYWSGRLRLDLREPGSE